MPQVCFKRRASHYVATGLL